mmetsp:Transcript_24564/g.49617  ORF Transcript_24564/g.49617 Transcript_24564/m.49617 type:complete len:438 (+) Transcript_24564:243-1556(+)
MPIASALAQEHRTVPVREVVKSVDCSSMASSLQSQSSTPSSDRRQKPYRHRYRGVNESSNSDEFYEHGPQRQEQNSDSSDDSYLSSDESSSTTTTSQPQPLGQFDRIRDTCIEVVEDDRMQIFILFLIMANSVMYGVGTYPFIKDYPNKVMLFEIFDLWFLIIFTLEISMSLLAYGKNYFRNGWSSFDFFIVTISWISIKVHLLKAFRVFRALRLISRVEILRNIVVALFSIIPQLTAIFFLLMLVIYIYAVMFTQLFKDMYEKGQTSTDFFGRIDYTFFTLFQILCLDEWASVSREVMVVYKWSWVLFMIFVVMTAFVVVNLLIAVICDAVHVLRTAERAMLLGYDVQLDGGDKIPKHIVRNVEVLTDEKIEKKVNELQRMLDEMVETQECMAMTIKYLSLALIPTFSYESTECSEDYSDYGSSFDAFNEYSVDRY